MKNNNFKNHIRISIDKVIKCCNKEKTTVRFKKLISKIAELFREYYLNRKKSQQKLCDFIKNAASSGSTNLHVGYAFSAFMGTGGTTAATHSAVSRTNRWISLLRFR